MSDMTLDRLSSVVAMGDASDHPPTLGNRKRRQPRPTASAEPEEPAETEPSEETGPEFERFA